MAIAPVEPRKSQNIIHRVGGFVATLNIGALAPHLADADK
jgi:hypothetical protein